MKIAGREQTGFLLQVELDKLQGESRAQVIRVTKEVLRLLQE